MDITLKKSFFTGEVFAPPSKSAAHRSIIAAALSGKKIVVANIQKSGDVLATIGAVEAIGSQTEYDDGILTISPKKKVSECTIDCKGSATTLRIMMPICAALGIKTTFLGDASLSTRTFAPLAEQLIRGGISFDRMTLPSTLSGKLSSGNFSIAGDVSSQFVSGLLFALPLISGNSVLNLTSPLQSKGYVDLTLECLLKSGVTVAVKNGSYYIGGEQCFNFNDCSVEGDYSGAAFWLVAGALNGDVTVRGLNENSLQGDKAIVDILKHAGVNVCVTANGIRTKTSEILPLNLDVSNIPDLVPALAVMLSAAKGKSVLFNAGRLKHKESDRLLSTAECLIKSGVQVEVSDDSLTIYGNSRFKSCTLNSFSDHRIAMAAAVMAAKCENLTLIDAHAVSKSYPAFFEDFTSLGGKMNVINLGM